MNPWDLLTWVSAFALAASGIVIFAFFLRDVRGILDRHFDDDDESDTRGDSGL